MEMKLLNLKGQEVGKYDMPEFLFNRKPDPYFLHEIITYYLANKHRGTACTKTRGEVSGGSKKPWKQKGTGRARAGSIRSPIWRKGGIVFGPKPRSFRQYLPEEKRRQGLLEALAASKADNKVLMIENLALAESKTKNVKELFKALELEGKKVLFVMDKPEKKFILAIRNIEGAGWSLAANINAYEILRHDRVVFTVSGINALAASAK